MFKKGLFFDRFFNPREGVMGLASKHVISCESSAPLMGAVDLLLGGYRKIPITKDSRLVGILTALDVLDYCGAGDKHSKWKGMNVPVGSVMGDRVIAVDGNATLRDVVDVFKEYGRGSHPIIRRGTLAGMISQWDLLKRINGDIGVKVEDLMIRRPAKAKGSYSVFDVARIMVKGGYRRLPVTRMNVLTGIVLPFDILRHMQKNKGFSKLREDKKPVSRVMKRDVHTLSGKDDVSLAVRLMLQHRIGGLPVVEDNELVGILTEGDVILGMM